MVLLQAGQLPGRLHDSLAMGKSGSISPLGLLASAISALERDRKWPLLPTHLSRGAVLVGGPRCSR